MTDPVDRQKVSRWRIVLAAAALASVAIGLALAIGLYYKDLWFVVERRRMVREDIEGAASLDRMPVLDRTVLEVMRRTPRHEFVPESEWRHAYDDRPVPIGYGQTVSQPYLVAYMTELLRLTPSDRVLEIGTSSGYHSAILAAIAKEVYTVGVVEELAEPAEQRLRRLGYTNIHFRVGDGFAGWGEYAPYDAILVRGAVDTIPPALLEQLGRGGRMVIPVGPSMVQSLLLVEKWPDGTTDPFDVMSVRFAPLVRPGEKEDAALPFPGAGPALGLKRLAAPPEPRSSPEPEKP